LKRKVEELDQLKVTVEERMSTLNTYSLEKYNKLKNQILEEIDRFRLN